MGTDLAKIHSGERGIQLNTLADMKDAAQLILQSGYCPDGYKKAEQVFVAIQSGAELGLKPMQSLNSFAVIRGRPTLWGDTALALVKKSGLLVEYSETIEGEGDKMVAKVKSTRNDGTCKSTVESSFSVQDAKIAGLWGKTGPWKTHPKRMLKYKARAFNLRDNFPDVLMGMHISEEMEGEEPLDMPDCDTPPRQDRRTVDSTVTDAEPENSSPECESVPESTDADMDGQAVGGKDVAGTGSISHGEALQKLYKGFTVKLGDGHPHEYYKASFQKWAAFLLMEEPGAVDSSEKFTDDMISHLSRELETVGVEEHILGG